MHIVYIYVTSEFEPPSDHSRYLQASAIFPGYLLSEDHVHATVKSFVIGN